MPGLNFDYTQFLKKQNALYLLKYQNDPVEVANNPAPIAGYSGHTPTYRSSIHKQRMVRSLVRCLTSPTKPTTAMGFTSDANRLPGLKRPSTAAPLPQSKTSEAKMLEKVKEEAPVSKRAQTAPPASRLDRKLLGSASQPFQKSPTPGQSRKQSRESLMTPAPPGDVEGSPIPSRISMMSAGSSDTFRRDLLRSPSLHSLHPGTRPPTRRSNRPHSQASTVSERPVTQQTISRYPNGYPQTLYGSSFWFMWPGDNNSSATKATARPESYAEDRKLNRYDDVIYHKHEGILPKYMGYVPGYKFRHGSTYGVLTSHAASYGAVYKQGIEGQ